VYNPGNSIDHWVCTYITTTPTPLIFKIIISENIVNNIWENYTHARLLLILTGFSNNITYGVYHLKRYLTTITYYGREIRLGGPHPCKRLSQSPPSHSIQGHPGCLAAAHASCAKVVKMRTWCIHKPFFLWRFLKEKVYSNNPRSLEEMKHNTEETVANPDPETRRKIARNTLKSMDACLWEGDDIFNICYKAIL
jgi:hypothetical protein